MGHWFQPGSALTRLGDLEGNSFTSLIIFPLCEMRHWLMICEVCPFPTCLDALAKTLTLLLSDSKREHTGNVHPPGSRLGSIARHGRSGYDSVVNDLTIPL